MKRYRKKYKVIALWNSYHSLDGSDFTLDFNVLKAMEYCLNEIEKLGFDLDKLPTDMNELIKYLDK